MSLKPFASLREEATTCEASPPQTVALDVGSPFRLLSLINCNIPCH